LQIKSNIASSVLQSNYGVSKISYKYPTNFSLVMQLCFACDSGLKDNQFFDKSFLSLK
jgi:hypothetical protein